MLKFISKDQQIISNILEEGATTEEEIKLLDRLSYSVEGLEGDMYDFIKNKLSTGFVKGGLFVDLNIDCS